VGIGIDPNAITLRAAVGVYPIFTAGGNHANLSFVVAAKQLTIRRQVHGSASVAQLVEQLIRNQ
jgi:hypothetical protein